jgi:predicted RNase H-like nuclease
MTIYGVDGCKGGWVVVSKAAGSKAPSFSVALNLSKLFSSAEGAGVVAIDIPIGLSDRRPRQCDIEARAFLGQPRGSSVFPAPCRCCLGSKTHEEPSRRNVTAAGAGLSVQCFGILPKIETVDALMSPMRQRFVREAHPEVSFAVLAGHAMLHNKTTKEGIEERLNVLAANGLGLTLEDIQRQRRNIGRGRVHIDDIIDATVCVLTAERIVAGQAHVFGGNDRDSRKLVMEIVS